MDTSTKHISFSELSELAEKRLEAGNSQSASEHLAGCSQCAEMLTRLENVFSLMKTDTDPDPPRDVLYRAINVFQPETKTSILRRVLAVLTFDSLTVTPAFGTRSGGSDSRQLIYNAENNDIDLHIAVVGNGWNITGQVLGSGCDNGVVELASNNASRVVQLDDTCEFSLPAVPPGSYILRLRLPDIEVEVPRLELRK